MDKDKRMNSQVKIPVSIGIRPALISKIDTLASQAGKSRSELITRIMGSVIDDLSRPEVTWVKISKDQLIRILTV